MICDKCGKDMDSTVHHKKEDIKLCVRCEVLHSIEQKERNQEPMTIETILNREQLDAMWDIIWKHKDDLLGPACSTEMKEYLQSQEDKFMQPIDFEFLAEICINIAVMTKPACCGAHGTEHAT